MRTLAVLSLDESSTISTLCTLEWSLTRFAVKYNQRYHDGLKVFFPYLLFLEQTFE